MCEAAGRDTAAVEETPSTRASNAISGSITVSANASSSVSANASCSNAISAGASSSANTSNTTIRQVEADGAKANAEVDKTEATDENVDVSCTALPPPRLPPRARGGN